MMVAEPSNLPALAKIVPQPTIEDTEPLKVPLEATGMATDRGPRYTVPVPITVPLPDAEPQP